MSGKMASLKFIFTFIIASGCFLMVDSKPTETPTKTKTKTRPAEINDLDAENLPAVKEVGSLKETVSDHMLTGSSGEGSTTCKISLIALIVVSVIALVLLFTLVYLYIRFKPLLKMAGIPGDFPGAPSVPSMGDSKVTYSALDGPKTSYGAMDVGEVDLNACPSNPMLGPKKCHCCKIM